MSTNSTKKNSDLKNIGIFLFVCFLVVIAIFASGCSVSSTTPDPEASSASTPSEAPKPETPVVPVFGETVSYDDGLSISVSAPAEYAPSEMAAGMIDGQPSVIFEFVLTNNSSEPFDPVLILATASSGGTEASGIFDTNNNVGFPPSTAVLPGATIKWNQAFSVADPSNITLEASIGFTHDPAIFVSSK